MHPPVNRITDRCKNITFATSLQTVMTISEVCHCRTMKENTVVSAFNTGVSSFREVTWKSDGFGGLLSAVDLTASEEHGII